MARRWLFSNLLLGGSLCSLFVLSGCDTLADLFRFNQDARAQQGSCSDGRSDPCAETLRITAGSFILTSDSTFQVNISETTTTYTNVSGQVSFTLVDGNQAASRELEVDDTVIERPSAGFITILYNNNTQTNAANTSR